MDYEKLKDSLDGLYAYDTGCTDSGIHDESLREECRKYIMARPPKDRKILLGKMTTEMFLSEKAVERGYGPEDAKHFLDWLDEQMGVLVI